MRTRGSVTLWVCVTRDPKRWTSVRSPPSDEAIINLPSRRTASRLARTAAQTLHVAAPNKNMACSPLVFLVFPGGRRALLHRIHLPTGAASPQRCRRAGSASKIRTNTQQPAAGTGQAKRQWTWPLRAVHGSQSLRPPDFALLCRPPRL